MCRLGGKAMWSSEAQFANCFANHLLRLSGDRTRRRDTGEIVLREYRPGYGRVDMILVTYDRTLLEERRQRINSDNCALDVYGAYVMAYLTHTRWVSIERIARNINLAPNRIGGLISTLDRRGLIEIRGELVKSRSKKANWIINRLEAFELKLEHWKQALNQASRHLWFASRSYIVLPGASEVVARRLVCNCSKHDVGVILGETSEIWKTIVSPSRATVPSSYVGWLLNETIVSGVEYD